MELTLNHNDVELFAKVVNQGIDSRLEGFTKLQINDFTGPYHIKLTFHPDEYQILIRRLLELEDERAELWADDLVSTIYGVEII